MDILPQLIFNSIIAGAIYSLIALGFNLIYGATKFFNLAHGVMTAIGGYAVFYFAKTRWLADSADSGRIGRLCRKNYPHGCPRGERFDPEPTIDTR